MRSASIIADEIYTVNHHNYLRDDARASSYLLPHQKTTPDLQVYVEAGNVLFPNNNLIVFAGGNSPTFTAPTTNPRIDLLVMDSTGTLVRIAGTENASPVAPSYPRDVMVICEIYNRVSQTQIMDVTASGKGYIYKDSRPFLQQRETGFGGTGADGALNITSGTTTLDFASANILTKNYSSISITGTGQLAFSNPASDGSMAELKSVSDVTITSSATPAIDLRLMGGTAGAGANSGSYVAGNGGRGAGGLYIECGGLWTFTGTIYASGQNGTDWSGASSAIRGGGGPGGGGAVVVIAGKIGTNTGTITTTAGTTGASKSSGDCGGSLGNNGTGVKASIGFLAGGQAGGQSAVTPTTAPRFFTDRIVAGYIFIGPGGGGAGGGASGCSTYAGGAGTGASISSGDGYSLITTKNW